MHPETLSSNKRVLVLVAVLGLSGDTIRSAVAQEAKPDKLFITSLRQHHGPDLVTQIFRVNADGSDRVALTSPRSFDADPALSPDGRRITFVTLAEGDRVDLYVMNSNGSGRKRLVQAPGDAPVMAPSWSPDGKRIAFCTVLPDNRRIFTNPRLYVVDADGRNLKRLGDVEGIMPGWSADGRRLLFTRIEEKSGWRLCSVNTDGSNVRELVRDAVMGAWSPDGRSLAYLQIISAARPPACLFVARADGSQPRRVLCGPGEITLGPQWSSDGKRLFFTQKARGEQTSSVYVIDLDGQNLRRVAGGDVPEWSGSYFYAGLFGSIDHGSSPREAASSTTANENKERAGVADKKTADWVEAVGGNVACDEKRPGLPIVGVDLASTRVTDAELKELSGLSAVTELDLHGTSVTDAGLKTVASLKTLQFLNLEDTQISDQGLRDVARLHALEMLNLTRTGITDAGLQELQGLQNLAELELLDTKITDVGLKHLGLCRSLYRLNLQGTQVTGAGLVALGTLKKLACVHLLPFQITDDALRALRNVDRLQALCGAGGDTDQYPKTLDDVTSFDLEHTHVTDLGLKHLADMKNLKRLRLGGTGVMDAGLKELAGFENLTELDLAGTKVTDAGLTHLRNLRKLSTLGLAGTQVTDAGLKELSGHTALTTLDLGSEGRKLQGVTEAGVAELRKILPKCLILR